VRVVDHGSDALHTWTIVSRTEANAGSGRLAAESPIAKALLGHVRGETVTVETPRGPRQLTIQDLLP
jgi:transcription elongation factor GreA